ncbi:hypothetical protein CFS9_34000 [Flavobacterium sp. CFS9]|uniref:Uncharacterized protein n=1 Tax=Flavobacterium sp. CFS9 TaxID=3143118 RepID=A0AAT9H4Q7_9FLAO
MIQNNRSWDDIQRFDSDLYLFRIIKNNLQNEVLALTFASEIKTNKK